MDYDKLPDENDETNINEKDNTQSSENDNCADEKKALENSDTALDKENIEKIKPKKSIAREIMGWVLTILIAFIIASLIRAFVFDHAVVDG